MKENKLLFYGCVVVTFVCAMWSHFIAPIDIEFIYEPETETIESETVEITNPDDFFIDVPVDDYTQDKETDDKVGVFSGCSARFKSKIWSRDLDGQSIERYNATNEIKCMCEIAGDVIERKVVYQYSSEPDASETDCNKKCVEICAEK